MHSAFVLMFAYPFTMLTAGKRKAPATKTVKQRSKLPPRVQEISLTVGRLHADVTPGDIQAVTAFLEEHAVAFALGVEKGGVAFKLHMQIVVKFVTTSPIMLKKLLVEAVKWHKEDRIKICAKELKGAGVHTWTGMIGYVTKDQGASHFQRALKGVTEEDVEAGRELYAALGAPNKNVVSLTQGNILDRALMYYKFKFCGSRFGFGFLPTVMKMLHSEHYVLAASWASSGRAGTGLDKRKVDLVWKSGEQLNSFTEANLAEVIFCEEGRSRYISDIRSLQSELNVSMREWAAPEAVDPGSTMFSAFQEHNVGIGKKYVCRAAELVAFGRWAKAKMADGYFPLVQPEDAGREGTERAWRERDFERGGQFGDAQWGPAVIPAAESSEDLAVEEARRVQVRATMDAQFRPQNRSCAPPAALYTSSQV